MDSGISLSSLKHRIESQYRREVESAKLKAYKRRNQRLRALGRMEKAFGDGFLSPRYSPDSYKARAKDVSKAVSQMVSELPTNTKFTNPQLFARTKKLNPELKRNSFNTTFWHVRAKEKTGLKIVGGTKKNPVFLKGGTQ